jgi:hypothetical protein
MLSLKMIFAFSANLNKKSGVSRNQPLQKINTIPINFIIFEAHTCKSVEKFRWFYSNFIKIPVL